MLANLYFCLIGHLKLNGTSNVPLDITKGRFGEEKFYSAEAAFDYICKSAIFIFAKSEKRHSTAIFRGFIGHCLQSRRHPFAKALQNLCGLLSKPAPKRRKAAENGRFSHFNSCGKTRLFAPFISLTTPKKRLCSAISRDKQAFAASRTPFSHSI